MLTRVLLSASVCHKPAEHSIKASKFNRKEIKHLCSGNVLLNNVKAERFSIHIFCFRFKSFIFPHLLASFAENVNRNYSNCNSNSDARSLHLNCKLHVLCAQMTRVC